jgi:hypothetical protein
MVRPIVSDISPTVTSLHLDENDSPTSEGATSPNCPCSAPSPLKSLR